MLGRIFNFCFFYVRKIRFSYSWGNLVKRGLIIGHNFSYEKGLIIDKIYPSFITIGNNVTFSANCSVLAHDAGLANIMGLVRVGKVRIGNNVFIGLGSTILPGVEIGDNVIIGAGSIVSKSIPANNVAAGCPCRIVCSLEDYRKKIIEMTNVGGVFAAINPLDKDAVIEMKKKMKKNVIIKKTNNYNKYNSLD